MRRATQGEGWIVFAAVMVLLAGTLNVIWGIAAINSSRFFVGSANYIVSDLRTWGWIVLLIGALQLFAAYSIATGGEFGRWFGIVMATLNAVAALLSIKAYPLWGVCMFALDALIIYGLAAYGGSRLAARPGHSGLPPA